MKTIGIRELRQRASGVLRLVERGVTFEVTDRGRPVGLIVPLPAVQAMSLLRAQGDVSVPIGHIDELPLPLELPSGSDSPSLTLLRLRANER